MMHSLRALIVVAMCSLTAAASPLPGQAATAAAAGARTSVPSRSEPAMPQPFTYEFYYKIEWGRFDEFLELYKKNHLPILRKQQERGEILQMSATFPINHMGEDTRWDFRMTVTYRDAVAAHTDPSPQAWAKALYPDQQTFKREELRRFALMLEHLDLPVATEDPARW